MTTSVAWFEIPVVEMGRAVEFYGTVLAIEIGTMEGPDGPMFVFPSADGAAGTFTTEDSSPADGGVLIYLSCPDIDAALDRVGPAGGEVLQARTSIGPHGFIGRLRDSEGNIVALHTQA